MSRRVVIALDVGGTTVDAACITAGGELVGGLVESGSPASGTADEIIAGLAGAIEAARRQTGECTVTACGIAMPGPFDHAAGASHMVHKFRAIYGLPLGRLLQARVNLPVYFINDAGAFGLGVGWRQLPDVQRFVALTIGTGLGGSFIEDGENVESDSRVPLGGEIWDLPYEDGILEDRASARSIAARYNELRPGGQLSAKEVAEQALRGNPVALQVYRDMGAALGKGLAETFAHFPPEAIVVGGKVAQSLALFEPAFAEALARAGLPVPPIVQAMPGNLAVWGAARHAFGCLKLERDGATVDTVQ